MTTHINTKPMVQHRRIVRAHVVIRRTATIQTASRKPHIPHLAPLMGADGNVIPIDS